MTAKADRQARLAADREHREAARTWQPMARTSPAGPDETWANDLYQAHVRRDPGSAVLCLSVRRLDGRAARDWRHLQAVKDDIAGPEAEAIELYPARSRLLDMSNTYWLWAFPPGTVLPFGFDLGAAYQGVGDELRRAGESAAHLAKILAAGLPDASDALLPWLHDEAAPPHDRLHEPLVPQQRHGLPRGRLGHPVLLPQPLDRGHHRSRRQVARVDPLAQDRRDLAVGRHR